jgi:Cu2+-containing amine oxidase
MSTAPDPQPVDTIALTGVDGYQFLGDDYTVRRKCTFVALYREHGSIFHAAKLTPVSRKTIYNWMAADEQFAEAVADSKEDSLDDLETSVYKRAFNDSLLAMFYLKAHRHKFRDKVTIDVDSVRNEIQQRISEMGVRELPETVDSMQGRQFPLPSDDLQKESEAQGDGSGREDHHKE